MSPQRLIAVAFWMVIITVSLDAPAMADFFHYRDTDGKLHLTNVWARIPPAYRTQAKRNRRADGDSAPKTAQPTTAAASKSVTAVRPTLAPKPMVPAAPRLSPTKPVNPRQFGLLRLRMSEHEVLRRLGPPASIIHPGSHTSPRSHGGQVVRVVQGQVWYYPGTERTAATRLEFHNGLLVHKSRERR